MTMGYGVRYPNEECPEAIIIMVLEVRMGLNFVVTFSRIAG